MTTTNSSKNCVWENDGISAPSPVDNQLYLVEIWQNLNGYKIKWYEVMIWTDTGWVLYSDPCKKLAYNQIAHKWANISYIDSWVKVED